MIFRDLMVPEMSGIELYSALTEAAPEQAARMIFLTGGAFSEGTRAFLEAVPNLTVEKPSEAGRVLEEVSQRLT